MIRALVVLLLSTCPLFGQTVEADRIVVRCDNLYELCGLRDWQTGEPVGPQNYKTIERFREGLAAAVFEEKYGYINKNGELAIPEKFDDAGRFIHGLAPVVVDDKVAIIDKSGKFIVPPRFVRAYVLSGQVIAGYDGNWNGDSITYQIDSIELDITEQGAGLYHIQHGWLTEQVYGFEDYINVGASDLIWASISVDGDDLFGLMRIADGSWVIEPSFREVIHVDDDDRPVSLWIRGQDGIAEFFRGEFDRFGKVNLVRRKGGLICPDGTAIFRNGDLWGMQSPDGSELFSPVHRALSCFDDGVVWLPVSAEDAWCAFGPDGKRREKTACKKDYIGYRHRWGFDIDPEKLHDDPFESSILWMRKMLDVLESPLRKGPALVSDDKNPVKSEVRCWECLPTPF
jgi:hypothetical protein